MSVALDPRKIGTLLTVPEETAVKSSIMISYSRKDREFAEKLHPALTADDRDVRIIWEDTFPTAYWVDRLHKEIEESDIFLCILSPDSIKSEACNWEVDYAVKLGKRIIPVVAREIEYADVREELATLNYFFFRPEDDFDTEFKLLTKTLDKEAVHAFLHTQIVCAAIAWEKSDFDNELVLQGDDIRRAQDWMSDSAMGALPSPTPLHLDYITASGSNADTPCPYHENPFYMQLLPEDKSLFGGKGGSMKLSLEDKAGAVPSAFIAYDHADIGVARRVFDSISKDGRSVIVEWEEPVLSADWLSAVNDNIDNADNFIFILSPDSVTSEPCNWMVDHAAENGKNIIPLVARDVDFAEVRFELTSESYVFVRDADDHEIAVERLVSAMDKDPEHSFVHTKLVLAASEWTKSEYDNKHLLQSDDLKVAYEWLCASALGKSPKPTTVHMDFITASMKATRPNEAQKKLQREKVESKENNAKAEKYFKKGIDLLEANDHFKALEQFTKAAQLQPTNVKFQKASEEALNKSKTCFVGSVRGLPLMDYRFANPTLVHDTSKRKALIEIRNKHLRVQVSQSKGILLKKVTVEKHFFYAPEMKVYEHEKKAGVICLDVTGDKKIVIQIPTPPGLADASNEVMASLLAKIEESKTEQKS